MIGPLIFAGARFTYIPSRRGRSMAGAIRPEDRPVSPFLTVWRWHITMACSILHRVTGTALYGAAILFAGWLMVIAAGPEAYAPVGMVLASPLGQVALY